MLEAKKCVELDAKHLDLIARRCRRMGFRGADLDDASQEAAIAVMAFEFDEERANGASLETALTAVIDHCLLSLRRKHGRYAKHLEQFLDTAHAKWSNCDDEPVEPHYEEPTDLRLDVQAVLATLSIDDQRICSDLAAGRSVHEIAKALGCDWHTVRRQVERVREVFEARGLGRWLKETE